jgi:hypothetical protein
MGDNLKNMTTQELAHLRAAQPPWVKSGLFVKDPVFTKSTFTPKSPSERLNPKRISVPLGLNHVDDDLPCCFYGFDSGGFAHWGMSDLPAAIVLAIGTFYLSTTDPGTYYPSSGPGDKFVAVNTDGGGSLIYPWTFQDSGTPPSGGTSSCLFGNYADLDPTILPGKVFDTFASTLSLSGGGYSGVTLTRTVAPDVSTGVFGSCLWVGSEFSLLYVSADSTQDGSNQPPNVNKFVLTNPAGVEYVLSGNQTAPNASGANNYTPYTVS